MKNILLAGILAVACTSVSANSFVLTTGQASKASASQSFSLDFISDGDGTTLVVKVGIPETDKASVNLAGCGKGLPSGFVGQCAVAKGNLIMIVSSDTNELLPKGAVSLGMFSVTYADKQPRQLSITSTEVSSPEATELQSSAAQ